MDQNKIRTVVLERMGREEFVATWWFGKSCGGTPKVLRVMKKLEKEGVIKKHRYSTSNNCIWELKC